MKPLNTGNEQKQEDTGPTIRLRRYQDNLRLALNQYYPELVFWACERYYGSMNPKEINQLLVTLPEYIQKNRTSNLSKQSFRINLELFQKAFDKIVSSNQSL